MSLPVASLTLYSDDFQASKSVLTQQELQTHIPNTLAYLQPHVI